ncbi:hypothetical protein GCM10023115_26400 [Pontixanthobacter gangjinensis]|uniref:Uncharacterized protein n=1 Tax=Christiangramia aestuarii TaxID=1028746 RepID=A0A7K1LM65_9FLAO|nr:hypothetical protein [Christiangramia aestuarii]MUP41877.1 hypothetical protein [Christiangramia aestuarii]
MHKKFYLPLIMAVMVLLSSCQKDENLPQNDFSIESEEFFKVISQHPNGWIKEARNLDYTLEGNIPLDEFEYYENGYIKYAKVYSSYPQQHLSMEISRSEDNKPLWSKYYTTEGDLWFETEYEDGLPKEKKVYSEKGTAVHTYSEGELISVIFTTADGNGETTTIFDPVAGTKKVTILKNAETILEEEYAYQEGFGDGILTSNQVPLANPFTDPEAHFRPDNSQFSHSPIWEYSADPIDAMPYFRDYSELYFPPRYFDSRLAVNSSLYQSVIEQYPITEDEVLISNFKHRENNGDFLAPSEERKALKEEMENDPELFELKYGNEYVETIHYGKYFFIIGALRNMPTSEKAAQEIKGIARKRMDEILSGKDYLNAQERETLSKVWFEVKFFSNLKQHHNGIVMRSSSDYDAATEEFLDAESTIVRMEYRKFEHLYSEN